MPAVGVEPTPYRLRGECSAFELGRQSVPRAGVEPAFRRPERRVLPLDDLGRVHISNPTSEGRRPKSAVSPVLHFLSLCTVARVGIEPTPAAF